jgi:hypothetical protein
VIENWDTRGKNVYCEMKQCIYHLVSFPWRAEVISNNKITEKGRLRESRMDYNKVFMQNKIKIEMVACIGVEVNVH